MRARVVDGDGDPLTDWVEADKPDAAEYWLLPFAVLLASVRGNLAGLAECEIEIVAP